MDLSGKGEWKGESIREWNAIPKSRGEVLKRTEENIGEHWRTFGNDALQCQTFRGTGKASAE